ncbi:fumarylacetoacetate hydrolase family protein [Herbiconiux sp. KACC 21604]|uniref:2-keto-4-pentenoate hydratase n=1 Tax=unclassified Herbiconiux TaxID=2618217 RepID=UPI00149166D9|nr:fumarylacetoacetate hydrolase family protein [Herbiconiux sp. SALV-R1]QJU55314.1 4-oxalocrotonate decarboxylase [Herbiconiux sp. SALV-R1]WPO86482.1 fumarylacetoacetate hydrolase family protein [Herbiconiux sp. KACC 21604]
MAVTDAASAARALVEAERERAARGRLTVEWPGLDLGTAYAVQRMTIGDRVRAGDRVIGTKLGLTSAAKQQRMGISSPLTAVLVESYLLRVDQPVPLDELIQPRIEPEIVFVLGRDLEGPGVTAAAALAAVDRVYAGFEIIDSRFEGYDFALPDVVADNGSSAYVVVGGNGVSPSDLDLGLEAVVLSVDGQVVATATGAAVQGHPAEALALAVNALAERGQALRAGEIVFTGGLTDAVPLRHASQVSAEFTTLGALVVTGYSAVADDDRKD